MPTLIGVILFPILKSLSKNVLFQKIRYEAPSVQAETLVTSFQHGVLESRFDIDVSGGIRATWMPAIHAGMTKIYFFMF